MQLLIFLVLQISCDEFILYKVYDNIMFLNFEKIRLTKKVQFMKAIYTFNFINMSFHKIDHFKVKIFETK